MKPDADQNAIRNTRLILIVDDEPDIASTYSVLFGHYDFSVITVNNGQEALDILADTNPDIILSDYMMPVMNGAELCVKLKQDSRFNQTIFILTSAGHPPEKTEVPYDLFMQKPVLFSKLLNEINQLFPGSSS